MAINKGRSILGDLLEKLMADPNAQARFVSETSANPLALICKDAELAHDANSLLQRLSAERLADYERFIRPCCGGNDSKAFDVLRRLRVVNITSHELQDAIEREIDRSLYRTDGHPLDPPSVRRFCGDFILESLGKPLTRKTLLQKLRNAGLCEANWARNSSILDRIARRNDSYRRSVRGQLINGATIHRQEAEDAFNVITNTSDRFGAFVGAAGLGTMPGTGLCRVV